MRDKDIWKILAISVILAVVASSVAVFSAANLEEGIGEKGVDEDGGEGVISLMAPPFVGVAGAAEAAGGDVFPEDEAGISAYVNICQKINLEKAETAFKSIETANETYIIGQIALDGYDPEYVAPHAYIHKDGWIVTYYLKNEPSGKIMQWNGYDGGKITTTTLADTIKKVCDSIQSQNDPPGTLYNLIKDNVSYYDFEFPNANKMMLITEYIESEEGVTSDTFNLTVPAECQLYEASWSHYCYIWSEVDLQYSKVEICPPYPAYTISNVEESTGYQKTKKVRKYGMLTSEYLSADDVLHRIIIKQKGYRSSSYSDTIGDFCIAIVLIYRTS